MILKWKFSISEISTISRLIFKQLLTSAARKTAYFLFIYQSNSPFLYSLFYFPFPPLILSRSNFIVAELFPSNTTVKGGGQMRDGLVYFRE